MQLNFIGSFTFRSVREDKHKIRAIQTLNWWCINDSVLRQNKDIFFRVESVEEFAATLARFRITFFLFVPSAYFKHCIEHVFFSVAAAAAIVVGIDFFLCST